MFGAENLPIGFVIQEVIQETPTIKTFVLQGNLQFQPGQFVMAWLPRVEEKPLALWRLRSAEIRLAIAEVGPCSRGFCQLEAQQRIFLRGPFGRGFRQMGAKKIVAVGGGFGVAPLLNFGQRQAGVTVDFIIGARTQEQLFGVEYARKFGRRIYLTTDDGSAGRKGRTAEVLAEVLGQAKVDLVVACGPERMLVAVAEVCAQQKIACQLSMERMMKCGFGVCGACAVDQTGLLVCRDGPIFTGEQVLRSVEFGNYKRDGLGQRVKLG